MAGALALQVGLSDSSDKAPLFSPPLEQQSGVQCKQHFVRPGGFRAVSKCTALGNNYF